MAIVLADGPAHVEIKGDLVVMTFTSGGEVYSSACKLADAQVTVADFLQRLSEREDRDTNLVAFPRRHADRA